MVRLLLLAGIALLQISPELTNQPTARIQPPHVADEAEVDSLMPTAGAPVPVLVETLEGVPADARERDAFLRGFRSAFQEREQPTERFARRAGTWKRDAPVRYALRLSDGVDEKGTWTVRARLDWFTPRDSVADSLARAWPGRGVRVAIVARPPESHRGATAPLPGAGPATSGTEWLRFPSGHPVDAAYYQQAGRQVACLVIELLERVRGELADDQRLRLDGAARVPPPVGR